MPKRGFSNENFERRFHIVNLADLERFENGTTVDAALLIEAGLLLTQNVLPASRPANPAQAAACTGNGPCIGNSQVIGQAIFTSQYLWPFEVSTIVLLVAVVGAIVLTKRRVA